MENKYYLAVETKPKNYFPINLLDVSIFNKQNPTSLSQIDALTKEFTKNEILSAIKEANIIEIEDNMPLVVIYYEKKDIRKIPALTSDKYYDMWALLKENYEDKTFINKIDNFFKNKINEEEYLKIKNSTNLQEFLLSISNLNYETNRKLYFYLYENRI